MLKEVKNNRKHYFINELGRRHGKYKDWHKNGQIWEQSHYVNDKLHGEYKQWYENGKVCVHCFYVNGHYVSFKTLPYPTTGEERMLFKLKYDIPLLPVENVC